MKIKISSIKEYLDNIKPYLKDFIYNLKKSDTWKIQLTIAINFVSFNDAEKEHEIYSRCDNIEIMIYHKAD